MSAKYMVELIVLYDTTKCIEESVTQKKDSSLRSE